MAIWLHHAAYIVQVDTIQSALQGMQTKLAQVQKDIGEQLERYEYLVDDKTERSAMSTPVREHDPSHPGTMRFGDEGGLDPRVEMMDAADSHPARPCHAGDPADTSTPGAACPGTDDELTTYFQKQEQGHQPAVMQAAAETEALGYM